MTHPIDRIEDRLVRMETRMVQLMHYLGANLETRYENKGTPDIREYLGDSVAGAGRDCALKAEQTPTLVRRC